MTTRRPVVKVLKTPASRCVSPLAIKGTVGGTITLIYKAQSATTINIEPPERPMSQRLRTGSSEFRMRTMKVFNWSMSFVMCGSDGEYRDLRALRQIFFLHDQFFLRRRFLVELV